MKTLSVALIATLTILTGCATGGVAGDYGYGDDSSSINANRNSATARLSRSELENQSRQRQSVAEEIQLGEMKRQAKQRETRDTMQTVREGLNMVRDIKSFFKGY